MAVAVYLTGITSYFTLEHIQHYGRSMRMFTQQHYLLSVFAYCLVFVLATLLFIPITIILTILGGYLFGVIFGVLYAVFSATLGSLLIFLLVRYVFAKTVERRFAKYVELFKYELKVRGYSYFLMLQLLPVTPTAVINITAGLLPISAFTFAWTAFIGILPGSLFYVVAGASLTRLSTVDTIISWPIFFLFFVLAFLVLLIPYAIRYKTKL